LRLRAVLLSVALVFGLFLPSGALAHSALVSSNPAAGADLSEAPDEVRLKFNEELLLLGNENPNKLEVINSSGEVVSGEVMVSGPEVFTLINKEIAVSGEYSVRYRVVSADGHPVEGEYKFTITGPEVISAPISPAAEDGPNLLVRFLFASVLLGIGALALLRLRK
jgi:methionine-rich copper-binding protein CopC